MSGEDETYLDYQVIQELSNGIILSHMTAFYDDVSRVVKIGLNKTILGKMPRVERNSKKTPGFCKKVNYLRLKSEHLERKCRNVRKIKLTRWKLV